MPEDYPPGYEATREALRTFAQVYNRLEVEGLEHLPPPGQGALLACNHDNYSDPFYLGVAIENRYLRFLAWQDAFSWPLVGKFMENMGALPVPSSNGRANDPDKAGAALRALADHMRQGGLAGIFPEGRIKPWVGDDALKAFRTGAVRAAAMAGAPIVPAALYGSRWVLPNLMSLNGTLPNGKFIDEGVWAPIPLPAKVYVAFSEPMAVNPKAASDKETAKSESQRLHTLIKQLRRSLKNRYPGTLG